MAVGPLTMRVKLLIVVSLALAICGFCGAGCKKAKGRAKVDPHSAEGVFVQLRDQERLLNEALARKDFRYIHDYGYYFTGLVQALFSKLDADQKQRLRTSFDELLKVAMQLDRSAGGSHPEATAATLQRVKELVNEIDSQLRASKSGG